MGYLSEKAAYLKGLAEGLNVDESSNEGKLLVKIIEALEEFAATIEDNSDAVEACEERVDELEDFADDLMECFSDCCGDDHDGCDCCDCDDEDYDDEEFYEVECPHCNEKVYFDEDMLDDELICPNCNGKIEIEFED